MSKKKSKIEKILPNHLAIYIRVSTGRQVKEGYSLQDQMDRGIVKAKELGWTYKVFDDSGVSGDINWVDRPGIKSLINLLGEGGIGGLYTVQIDRLSRDGDYIEPQVLITMFKKSGIRIFDKSGEVDIKNETVELAMRFQGLFASQERNLIKVRTSAGAKNSILAGNTAGGGGLMLYGYDKVDKKLVVNKEQAKVIKQIFKWYIEGKGAQTIAGLLNEKGIPTKRNLIKNSDGDMTIKISVTNKQTGEKEIVNKVKKAKDFVWRDSVVYSLLTNTTYKGDKKWAELTISVPPIIDAEKFDLVQTLMKEKMKFKRAPYTNVGKVVNQFLLKGLIRCGKCGKSFYGHKRIDLRDKAYKCLSHRYKAEWCGNRGIDIDYLENLVWNNLLNFEKEVINTYKYMESGEGVKMYYKTKEHGESVIAENTKHLLSLARNYNEGKIKDSVYNSLMKEYEGEIEKQQGMIKDVENDNFLVINKRPILQVVKEFTKGMKIAETFEEKQSYVRAFVDKIIIMSDNSQTDNYHHNIFIYYKLDQLTQFHLKGEIDVIYKKNWHKIRTESKALTILKHQEVKNSNEDYGEGITITGF